MSEQKADNAPDRTGFTGLGANRPGHYNGHGSMLSRGDEHIGGTERMHDIHWAALHNHAPREGPC